MAVKKLVGLLIALPIIGASFYFLSTREKGPTLNVCIWSNYLTEDEIKSFQEKTGIHLNISYMSSNEELFAKLKAGATDFDIVQPSDYMVRQLIRNDMIQPLQHSLLKNLHHIESSFKNLPYDPGLQYSIPFTWGTTGIAINTSKVKLPKNNKIGWDFLFNSPDLKHTSLLDDMREVFIAALKRGGHHVNTKDKAILESAQSDINSIKDKILMFTSEPKAFLVREELYLSHIYSCDGIQAAIENPNIRYFVPEEGGTLWTDNFAVLKSSSKISETHRFLDYFLSPENAERIAIKNHLTTANHTAKKRLPKDTLENPNYYPTPGMLRKLQMIEDLGDTMTLVNHMWTELKSS